MLGTHELTPKSNYFMGNDPQKCPRNVPNYLKVRYENIYPGIDMKYYSATTTLSTISYSRQDPSVDG